MQESYFCVGIVQYLLTTQLTKKIIKNINDNI